MSIENHFGFVTLLGKPNAGKSSLLNALIGKKISAVSQKPQTTRNRIVGLKIFNKSQFAFIDTPGLHNPKGMPYLNKAMVQTAMETVIDADAIFYLVDVQVGLGEEDLSTLQNLVDKKTLILFTKVDKIPLFEAEKLQKKYMEVFNQDPRFAGKSFKSILCSSKTKSYIESLLNVATPFLPKGPWLFPEDQLTDVSQNVVCTELIREQIFRCLGQELPYSVGVVIESLKVEKNINIMAKIFVSKPSHKPMIIGKKGEKIKQIGIVSRASLENFFGKQVVLKLFVAVSENWVNSVKKIGEIQNIEMQSKLASYPSI